ncbi:hypothetical protein O1611_g2904 [Lasiodiplodia mahajangana]|uniref:Uncharacterized protein n=1 Tax=Lasiodiplodia mahajangana TaxID=1108764 RepID=A0ACC2JTA5_9PEZI|nr:hypothetical protein O1611_g2904 [Lasiodiplodia mahajangana]
MSQDPEQPELWAAVKRRYGPYDVQRFDNLLQASVGSASFGKVHVDCKFLFKKSKWGTLDNRKAGIIYLELTFSQPGDYRLSSATIQVTLDDEDKHLVQEFPNYDKPSPLQIRECGPRQILGGPRSETVLTRNKVMPELDVGSVAGIGGVGHESVKKTVRECLWRFESHIQASKKAKARAGAYKVLQWNITENELQPQPSHRNTFYTAFSFDHGGQPFFMAVEVRGKLRSKTSDFRHKLGRMARFSRSLQSPRSTTTLIHFKKSQKFTTPLDDLERRLHQDLRDVNMPDPAPEAKEQIVPEIQPPELAQPPLTVLPTEVHRLLEEQEIEGPATDEIVAHASEILRPLMTPNAPASGPYNSAQEQRPIEGITSSDGPQSHASTWKVALDPTVHPVAIWIWVMQIVAAFLGHVSSLEPFADRVDKAIYKAFLSASGTYLARIKVEFAAKYSLMREGFYWDSSNVKYEDGYINLQPDLTKCIFDDKGSSGIASGTAFSKI